jgi:hypothetical protein
MWSEVAYYHKSLMDLLRVEGRRGANDGVSTAIRFSNGEGVTRWTS